MKPARGDPETIDWLGEVFVYLFLFRFCDPLGLVRISREDSRPEAASASEAEAAGANAILAGRYSITGLFKAAFAWP